MIAVVNQKRPTEDMVRAMFEANDAGGGIAWRENGLVKWEKGLDVEGIVEMCLSLPLPYVAHFRIPTEGGRVPELTHPFPIEKTVSLELKGQTKGSVLFHNGHWGQWRGFVMDTLVKPNVNVKLPDGTWSDTRAMAWVASIYGTSILNFINEKAVVFGPAAGQLEVFESSTGAKWAKVDDVYVSNRTWEYRMNKAHNHVHMGYAGGHEYTSKMCKHPQCTKEENLDTEGYCLRHKRQSVVLPGEIANQCKASPCRRYDNIDVNGYCPGHQDVGRAIAQRLGGAATESPFDLADEKFRLAFESWKSGQLSNKKFKAARKVWEAALRVETARKTAAALHPFSPVLEADSLLSMLTH